MFHCECAYTVGAVLQNMCMNERQASGANGIVVVLPEKSRWFPRLPEAARRKTGGRGIREKESISYRIATLKHFVSVTE